NESEKLKVMVREKYAAIALQSKEQNETSCCGATSCCDGVDYSIFSESYTHLKGYNADADLGLGCGLPTEFAMIKEGDTVIDLGSGAGNDCFVARSLTGETGEVIGIDMTPSMVEKAKQNAEKLGFSNVKFRLGDIENMPVTSNKADVIISNCVLNLVPDKAKAFSEIYRVLKPGGHLSVSDVVLKGELPPALREAAELYAGCVSGAIPLDEYLKIMENANLSNIKIQKQKAVTLPDELLLQYLDEKGVSAFHSGGTGIFSITVYAEKAVVSCGCCDC
ncbi:MAG: arsenite methyltransferase, partial [Bacteroidales bacterium]|nr:arsenite methyltransferase [Bacteroidales bacterium]